ncbi:MAG TPA: hypothetical protein DD738_01910 [Ruminiclostridium sp.]|nr:hypothetical protein [Ruminiclostridium sp.]
MESRNRPAIFLLILCLLIPVGGCGKKTVAAWDDDIHIDMIVKDSRYDYWKVVKMGAEAAGKEFGVAVRFSGPTDEKNIEQQIEMVQEAIDLKTDAIVLAAGDYIELAGIAEKAILGGIPVVIIDSELKSDLVKSFIATDNVSAGKKLGEALAEKVGNTCSIAIMGFVKGTAPCVQREEGLHESLKNYPKINVLTKEYCNSNEDTAEKLTEQIVEKYPDIDAIVCLNAYGTVGTARAIEKLDLAGKVKIIGFDSTPEEISFMEKDVIQSLVVQNPFSMGYLGVKYAVDAINNADIPQRVDTGSTVIDKNNMYLPENQKLVFPFTD